MLAMNQRRELRIETEQAVWVTIFGEPDIHLPACIKNVSARGVGLELQGPVAVGVSPPTTRSTNADTTPGRSRPTRWPEDATPGSSCVASRVAFSTNRSTVAAATPVRPSDPKR